MYQHDNDSDGEVYFLKPVNEYNIAEKVKEANKELFEKSNTLQSPSSSPPTIHMNRKVQFRENLEDYECENDSIVVINLDDNTSTVITSPIEEETVEKVDNESELDEICEEIESLEMTKTTQIDLVEDDDEDDKLSVIVASYLPEDDDEDESELLDQAFKSPSQAQPNRFSFRLRKKQTFKIPCSKSVDNVKDVQMNYKICCEYRNSDIDKLPKYTGYLSEYGLTKEQWEKRDKKQSKCRKLSLERNLKATETEMKKMEDNERAFTRWLKNKMRFPVNKTRNMFDFKSSRSKKSSKVTCNGTKV